MTTSAVPEGVLDQTLDPMSPVDQPAPALRRAGDQRGEVRLRLRQRGRDDVLSVAGAAVGSLSLTWLVFERLLPLSGIVGFWLVWYLAFLAFYAAMAALLWGCRDITDRLASVVFHSGGVLVVGAMTLVVSYTAVRGWAAIHHLNFFTQSMALTGTLDPITSGGVLHALVGSLEQLAFGVLFSVPLGFATAVFLTEVRGPLARPVRLIVDTMSALPSIIAGLFILAVVVLTLGVDKSGIAAALAISLMMLPIVTRAAEVVLRLVPGGLREAAFALGASQRQVVRQVVLPTARSGLATAVVLAMARGVGETSPVLLTAGFTAELNANPFHGPQVSLPLFTYIATGDASADMIARGYGAALALLVVVFALFVTARLLGGRGPGQLSQRQRRRIARDTEEHRGSDTAPATAERKVA